MFPCCKSQWAIFDSRRRLAMRSQICPIASNLAGFSNESRIKVLSGKPSTQCIFNTGYQLPEMRMPRSKYWKSTVNGRRTCWICLLISR